MRHKHIFLTGFMGAGKSTVGTFLAHELGLGFVDTDQRIMQRYGMNINSIFAHYGEAYFRSCETTVLRELGSADQAEDLVVSTGGGIVGREENLLLMRQAGTSVYLHASWHTLKRRLKGTTDRPLARHADSTRLHALWQLRQPAYQSADIVVDTDGLSPRQVVKQIVTSLDYSHESM